MDARDLVTALQEFENGTGPRQGSNEWWLCLYEMHPLAGTMLTDYGRDVLELLRLGQAEREKQEAAPRIQATLDNIAAPQPRRLVTPPCPKCGGETGPKWDFTAGEWPNEYCGPRCMQARCNTCGYSWPIPALDEEG